MIGLLCFVLAALASPFKSKIRLEAENAALPTSVDCFAAQAAWARQTRKQRSLVLHPAISLVSINPQGPHGHPSRDAGSLASDRLSQLLALEVTIFGRTTTDRFGPSRTDPADERRKLSLGRAAHPR